MAPDRTRSATDREAEDTSQSQEHGDLTYKRRRIGIACTSCRVRKSRCNGAKPSCSLCVQLGFQCVYEQPTKHATQPVSRPRDHYDARLTSIESTLKLLLDQRTSTHQLEPQGQARSPPREMLHSPLLEDVATLGENEQDLLDDSEDTVDGMATIAQPRGKDPRFFGPSSNIALLEEISKLLGKGLSSRKDPQRPDTLRDQLVSRMPSPRSSVAAAKATPQSTSLCALPTVSNSIRMIERFFSDTGMLFPFVSKDQIMHSYNEARLRHFQDVRRTWLCLMNMIFAFAMFTDDPGSQSMMERIQNSKVYFSRAQGLLAESHFRLADLEVVQCLVLMSQYRQGTQRSDETWSLHGLAVYAATQIGLSCVQPREPRSDNAVQDLEMRKRTWFACLILDSTLCMTLGRPLSIPRSYAKIDHPRSVMDEQITRSDGVDTVCFFTATIELYNIQDEILVTLYGNNCAKDMEVNLSEVLPEALKLESRLNHWERHYITVYVGLG